MKENKKQIDYYSILVASKYFETIDDFINLELSSPRFEGNIEKLHFNPISLTSTTKKFFTSLETLHLFTRDDERFEDDERIFQRVIWYQVDYEEYLCEKELNSICMNVIYTRENKENYGSYFPEGIHHCDSRCFSFDHFVETIEIPDTVTEIRDSSFRYCLRLSSLKLPSRLASIGGGVCEACNNLLSITIPESVTFIGPNSFQHCRLMTSLKMPKSWKAIGDRFYNNKQYFVSFKIPSSISLLNGEEYISSSRKHFSIPSYVTTLAPQCFYAQVSLQSIHIPKSIKRLESFCFGCCYGLESITLPHSVTFLGEGCFYRCKKLRSVKLSHNLKVIPKQCFFECFSLKSISLPEKMTTLDSFAFAFCDELTHIELNTKLRKIKYSCFYNCRSIPMISIPSSVTRIGESCFKDCHCLQRILLPSNLNELEDKIFSNCFMMASIQIPSSVKSIGKECFDRCLTLNEIIIPTTVTSIDNCAFQHCFQLEKMIIPNSVISLGKNCFNNCSSLSRLFLPSSLTSFPSVSSFVSRNIPLVSFDCLLNISSLTTPLGFRYDSLESLTLSPTITHICHDCFCGLSRLTSLKLAPKWTSTANRMFNNLPEYSSFVVPFSLEEINGHKWKWNVPYSIKIPSYVTKIKSGCFSSCLFLKEITIPSHVKIIEPRAFEACHILKKVYISPNTKFDERKSFPPSVVFIDLNETSCFNIFNIFGCKRRQV